MSFGSLVLGRESGRRGAGLTECALRAVLVVVMLIVAEHGWGMLLVNDQDTVEEFTADSGDEAFANRVGPAAPGPVS